MPADIAGVWAAVSTFFSDGLGTAVSTLVATPIFCPQLLN